MADLTDPLALLSQVAPAAAAQAVGVEPTKLDILERELGVQLPVIYRRFLETMGRHTGGFAAVDPTHTTCLEDLLAELPGPDERTSRYWRVSIERQLIKPFTADFYLDLSTTSGGDAELVTFDYPPDDSAELGAPVELTFSEQFRRRLFRQYVAVRPETHYWVYAPRILPSELGRLQARIHEVLTAEGIEPFAPASGRLGFYRGRGYAIGVRAFDSAGGLGIEVEAPGVVQALDLVEKLRDRMPDTTQMTPPQARE